MENVLYMYSYQEFKSSHLNKSSMHAWLEVFLMFYVNDYFIKITQYSDSKLTAVTHDKC